jgi:hypothetical protein
VASHSSRIRRQRIICACQSSIYENDQINKFALLHPEVQSDCAGGISDSNAIHLTAIHWAIHQVPSATAQTK